MKMDNAMIPGTIVCGAVKCAIPTKNNPTLSKVNKNNAEYAMYFLGKSQPLHITGTAESTKIDSMRK